MLCIYGAVVNQLNKHGVLLKSYIICFSEEGKSNFLTFKDTHFGMFGLCHLEVFGMHITHLVQYGAFAVSDCNHSTFLLTATLVVVDHNTQ